MDRKIEERFMRFASVLLAVATFGVSHVATFTLSASAAEFGTRDEAVAMVQRVQEKFKKDGPDATFKAINNKAFVDRDLFPWVYRLSDGTNMANALYPAVRGKKLIDLTDQDGKFIAQEWIRIANTPPHHGWSNYRWPNPVTNMDDDNAAWVERMGDYVVGVGIHRFERRGSQRRG
jgi:signal transduction histidine kinase